ncbi:uncharacterized protein AB675_858 [Cyphellophora attinorum]|uniref:Uncharacterized protein n=1 Tax=Cyphellophora attinorum TaxID=1664694 RepID=A0A0N1HHX6_9EURO|nr:uncharacterized protein AB675_858 [Phialophora attinorum]KPI45737.1 hypothetical protein AB675_858 [Phialophora attinorum]
MAPLLALPPFFHVPTGTVSGPTSITRRDSGNGNQRPTEASNDNSNNGMVPESDSAMTRTLVIFIAVATLLFGVIWLAFILESKKRRAYRRRMRAQIDRSAGLADAGSMSKYDISVSDVLQCLPPTVVYSNCNVVSEKSEVVEVTEEEEGPSW